MKVLGPVKRLFVALWPPQGWVEGLAGLQARLRAHPSLEGARWVRAGQLHLTLAFLGDVPAGKVGEVLAAAGEAARQAAPFTLRPGALGAFPNWRQPRVLWLGLDGEGAGEASRFAASVRRALQARGVWYDPKPFRAHITLARLSPRPSAKGGLPAQELASLVGGGGGSPVSPVEPWEVAAVYVVGSRLQPGGPVYNKEGWARFGEE